MEIKRNKATHSRPEGDRKLDAPFLFIDFQQFLQELKNESAWEKNDRNGITVFKSEDLTILLTVLKTGAEIKASITDDYLTLQVLSGKIIASIYDEELEMEEKQEIVFHPHVAHSVKAISESALIIRIHKT